MAVLIIGTLDTKGREVGFVRDQLRSAGLETLVLDAGSLSDPFFEADILREQVFEAAGTSYAKVREAGDRGAAVAKAADGAAIVAADLHSAGAIEGVFGLGGSAGTTIASSAMRGLPIGIPKVLVSTLASGQTRPYLAGSDIALFPSIADMAGLNRLTTTILENASAAFVGMVQARKRKASAGTRDRTASSRPLIAATMFGVTTSCVDHARCILESKGFEVVVFHATGVGGMAMEQLIRQGDVVGVLDLTTTELADELVGGTLSAGPERLSAAAQKGVPQVVSTGALDMVNFGPMPTVPGRFSDRQFHVHNPTVTLMRTTRDENARLGAEIARKLSQCKGPCTIVLPGKGVSALDAEGKPFWDPEADAALFDAVHKCLSDHRGVDLIHRDYHINDKAFAELCAMTLLAMIEQGAPR